MALKLALGLIAKDEISVVSNKLKSIGNLFDEKIIVVDRPDKSILYEFMRVSEEYGCKLFFSDGPEYVRRNIYLQNCSCHWILTLDTDEEISPERVQKIKQELIDIPENVGAIRLSVINYIGYGRWVTTFSPKVIRITDKIRYNDAIYHPTVTHSVLKNGMKIGRSPQFIEHFGPLYNKNEFKKRLDRIYAMERTIKEDEQNCFLFSMLAVEYMSIGNIKDALKYIENALNTKDDQDKDFPRFLKALIYYRLNLPWLAKDMLSDVAKQKSFTAEAQLLLADLDAREKDNHSALNRILPYLEMHPDSVHLNLNCAALAVDIEPYKTIDWARKALKLLPTLFCNDIYKKGADYNPYTFQDTFVSNYTNVFDLLFRAYVNIGDINEARYWKDKEHQIIAG